MRNSPDGDYNYICHVVDHFSKYIVFHLKSKTAKEVALMVEERVLAYLRTLENFPFRQWQRVCKPNAEMSF